jgi:hypothetical protein
VPAARRCSRHRCTPQADAPGVVEQVLNQKPLGGCPHPMAPMPGEESNPDLVDRTLGHPVRPVLVAHVPGERLAHHRQPPMLRTEPAGQAPPPGEPPPGPG